MIWPVSWSRPGALRGKYCGLSCRAQRRVDLYRAADAAL